jgi:hypothetical protein
MANDGVVVDANIMSHYIQEKKNDEGKLYNLIEFIIDCCGLAINDRVELEWRNTTGDEFFNIWFVDCILAQRIKYVTDSNKLTTHQKNKIHNDYGLPRGNKSKDIAYIKCNINTEIRYILTEDIDFYDPKRKKESPKAKFEARNQRRGALCKFLKKKFQITVGLPEHCYEDLMSKGVVS